MSQTIEESSVEIRKFTLSGVRMPHVKKMPRFEPKQIKYHQHTFSFTGNRLSGGACLRKLESKSAKISPEAREVFLDGAHEVLPVGRGSVILIKLEELVRLPAGYDDLVKASKNSGFIMPMVEMCLFCHQEFRSRSEEIYDLGCEKIVLPIKPVVSKSGPVVLAVQKPNKDRPFDIDVAGLPLTGLNIGIALWDFFPSGRMDF